MRDEIAAKLKAIAEERDTCIGEVINALVEASLIGIAASERETLYRILLANEKSGMRVNGTAAYPADWSRVGGVSPEICREIAAGYLAWRRESNEKGNNS